MHPLKLPVVLLVTVLTAVAAITPARAQDGETELDELERKRDQLTVELTALDARVAELDETIEGIDTDRARVDVLIELVADDYEQAVERRRIPARTRTEIAITGFMHGDPRRNALLDELDTVRGSDVAARRRELYDAVIDQAADAIAVVDEELRSLVGAVDELRGQIDALDAARDESITARDQLGTERTALALELDETLSRIDALRALENKGILTGLPAFYDPTRPALAVKIDNVGAAHPQAGVNAADVVFVEEVEGGFTRLAAVFHSTEAGEVGPIRSSRTSDIDLLSQLNRPLFVNSGGNRLTTAAVAASPLVDIGAGVQLDGYYRASGRRAPHNLFSNTANLWALGAQYDTGTPLPLWSFREPDADAPNGATPIAGVSIEYGSVSVDYRWNGTGWARHQDGAAHVDTTGAQVAPTNVIIQFTGYAQSPADPLSPEAITVGSNPAWFLIDGTITEGLWRRSSADDPAEYVFSNGQPVSLDPGTTWVELARVDSATID